jgi:hypothetical protein
MAAYCLPKKYAGAFLKGLRDGAIVPENLMGMTSAERHSFFSGVIGEENAGEVNALFESKMLLKDQKRGLVTWAKQVAGITEPARRDLLAKISKLDRVLQPADEREFLADLAEKKLGVSVSADEAKEIFALSQAAETAKTAMNANLNPTTWTAFGRATIAMTEKIESLKPRGSTLYDKFSEIINVPKTIMSTMDLSAPFVQGWGMMSTRRFWEGFGQMFKYFAEEENYQNLRGYIVGHPDYEIARRAKVGITELGDRLTAREEAIQSSLVEKAAQYLSDKTGVPNVIRDSNRAFVGFLNYARFHSYTDLLTAARVAGEDVSLGSSAARDLARVVNDFSGRGAIGKDDIYASAGPILNGLFFAPRKTTAMVQMFNPVRYLNPNISPTARKAALRNLTGSLAATGAVIGLSRAMGAEVNIDPRSINFLKIGVGRTKFDITGGNAIYLRLLGRIATNESINAKDELTELGSGFGKPTRADLVLGFIRGKLAPVAGAIADALYGKGFTGQPFSVTSEMRDNLMPMTMGSYIDLALHDPKNIAAWIIAPSAIFGIGIQPPLPSLTKSGRDVWGEKVADGEHNDPVDKTLQRLGMVVNQPEKKIRGVTLTDAQYDQYQQYSGRMMKMALTQAIRTPGFERLPLGRQEEVLRATMTAQREQARIIMMMKNPDILPKSVQVKRNEAQFGSAAAAARRANR